MSILRPNLESYLHKFQQFSANSPHGNIAIPAKASREERAEFFLHEIVATDEPPLLPNG